MKQNPIRPGSKPIVSLRDLEHRLGEDRATLRALANSWKQQYDPFTRSKEPKQFQRVVKERKPRTIDNPSEQIKRVQRKILTRILEKIELPDYIYGAVKGRSISSHAARHLRNECVVKMDVERFFPNITSRHIFHVWRDVLNYSSSVSKLLTQLTTYDFHLPQGAPTSPTLANIFLASIYAPVLEDCDEWEVNPTTWIDDLTFSGKNAREVMETARKALADNGLKMSRRKVTVLSGKKAKVLTGVRLGARRIRAPKDKVGDIRAAIHKLKVGCIEPSQLGRYVKSIEGRISHIETICADDARPLREMLQKTLTKRGTATVRE